MNDKKEENEILLSTGKTLTVPIASKEDYCTTEDPDSVVPDKVRNVWGSSSGAGSDFLDIYRKQRNAEMARLEELDKKWREDMENQLFHSQRIYRIKKENDKSIKRKLKRDKKKQKIAFLKKTSKGMNSDTNNFIKSCETSLKSGEDNDLN